jgi:hypothetical protein
MGVEEIDSALQRLLREAEAIRANLLEVELDPSRELLEAGKLEGESAARWGEANATLAQLWQWHALLQQTLDRAVELRGTRVRLPAPRHAQLEELLRGPSIELVREPVPLERRHLLDGFESAPRCSADQLVERMSTAFDQAKTVLAAVGSAWDVLGSRLQAARTSLDSSAELARALGEGEPSQLDRLRLLLDQLTAKLSQDPLSVNSEEVQDLERSLQAVREDLDGLDEVRRRLGALLADARKLLGELRITAAEGRRAYEQLLIKIATPRVTKPLDLDERLERQLEDVAKMAQHCAWREACAVLEQWTSRALSLLEQGQRIVAENRAPLKERNELRGLLDACEAKARRLGLIEEQQLLGMFEEAHRRLYTAPTDLATARELVQSYRRTLAEHAPPRELSR